MTTSHPNSPDVSFDRNNDPSTPPAPPSSAVTDLIDKEPSPTPNTLRLIGPNRFQYDYEDYAALARKYAGETHTPSLSYQDYESLNIRDRNLLHTWLTNMIAADHMVSNPLNENRKNRQKYTQHMRFAYQAKCSLSCRKWVSACLCIMTGLAAIAAVFFGLQLAVTAAASVALTWSVGAHFIAATAVTAATATASGLSDRGRFFGRRKYADLHTVENGVHKAHIKNRTRHRG